MLMESSFRAARDGLDATIWHDGAMRPIADMARDTVALARPYAPNWDRRMRSRRSTGCSLSAEAPRDSGPPSSAAG